MSVSRRGKSGLQEENPGKAGERREKRGRNCALALFSADRVSAFIALRHARHKRVFTEGEAKYTFSFYRVRSKLFRQRERGGIGIRSESRRNIAFPRKTAPEKYASTEVYRRPKVCLCILQRPAAHTG